MVEGPGADSEEKHEPVSDIDTAAADSLKVLDLKRPIREADIERTVIRAAVRHEAVASSLRAGGGNFFSTIPIFERRKFSPTGTCA